MRTGTSQCRSSPSRSKMSCGRTRTSTNRSPGGVPAGPASPSPCRRMRSPLSTPAGIFTERIFSSSRRPCAHARLARVGDGLAAPGAMRAGLLHLEDAALHAHLAATVAGAAVFEPAVVRNRCPCSGGRRPASALRCACRCRRRLPRGRAPSRSRCRRRDADRCARRHRRRCCRRCRRRCRPCRRTRHRRPPPPPMPCSNAAWPCWS